MSDDANLRILTSEGRSPRAKDSMPREQYLEQLRILRASGVRIPGGILPEETPCAMIVPHGAHRWDTEDRVRLRMECPGIDPKEASDER